MRDFNVTFTWVRPNRQTGTTVMSRMALVARMKLLANISLTVIFLQQVLRHPDEDTLKLLLSEPVSQNKNKFKDRAGEPSPLMLQNSGTVCLTV